jgi:uncharacterized protein YecE (DUF72 family)
LYVGCSGFSYSAWAGHFYPSDLPNNKWLAYYSKVFDFVEIDSSFYRIPSVLTVKRWAVDTPESFRFAVKMPQSVTHEKRLGEGSDRMLGYFYEAMSELEGKLGAVLIQLPPSMTKNEGLKKLKKLALDTRFRHAIEVRHKSWFDDEVYEFLKANDICLAWSQRVALQTPPVVTTDFIYLRFIGDRSIPDSAFGKIQKDRVKEMQYWAGEIKKLHGNKPLKSGFVPANNHYAGFGPGTANQFLQLLGENQRIWRDRQSESKQSRLLDFS